MPPKKATGTNTAQSTSTMAIMGPLTSCMALIAACLRGSPCSIWRSTFSTTTIASSTTMPMARTMPNKVRVLIEKPSISNPAKVPINETGTATAGMIVARKLCRNKYTTIMTKIIAMTKVLMTSSMETSMKRVGL